MRVFLAIFIFQLWQIDCLLTGNITKSALKVPTMLRKSKPATSSGKGKVSNTRDIPFYLIASIKMYPSEFHICNAFFVSPEHLLTTARCVYSKLPHSIFVDVSPSMENIRATYKVKEIITHPEFDINPHSNDIAVIKLKKRFPKAPVLRIPSVDVKPGVKTSTYSWKFSPDQKNYILNKIELTVPSRAICSDVLNEYINCETVCGVSDNILELGVNDQGSPLIAEEENHIYALGMYNRLGPKYNLQIDKFLNLQTYSLWIAKKILRK